MSEKIVCRHCKQINTHYTGLSRRFLKMLMNFRASVSGIFLDIDICPICGTNFETGQRFLVDRIFGYMIVSSIYMMHAMVCSFILIMTYLILYLIVPERFDPFGSPVSGILLIIGCIFGIFRADRARKKGELITRLRPIKK
ncbi:MAG: hypothetical protein Q8Q33_06760 [Chlamydiota bacterium]|nr:hypothetical protein [Chlamydiota bacterium]